MSPVENGFYINGIPVPDINHFKGIGSTGGPIGVLNIDFIDKKFYFYSQSIDIYLSLWNLYDRKNIAEYIWSPGENNRKASLQWGLLPIIGIEYEL